jgi:hypothetical protein
MTLILIVFPLTHYTSQRFTSGKMAAPSNLGLRIAPLLLRFWRRESMAEQCKKKDVARVAAALERLDAAIRTNHERKPMSSFDELDRVLKETLAPVCDSPLIRDILEVLLGHCQADVMKRMGSFPSFKSDKTPTH